MRRFMLCLAVMLAVVPVSFARGEEAVPDTQKYVRGGGVISATSGVEITEENFPDAVFREYVRSNFDKNGDGLLSEAEIEGVIYLYIDACEYRLGSALYSLEGIQYFTSLGVLNCDSNKLTTLDLSKNTALFSLRCINNELKSLDVSGCANLQELSCSENQLTSLDVSGCTVLEELYCTDNQLTSLDLSKNLCIDLDRLYCDASVSVIYPIENTVEINADNFPNDTFRAYVLSECDTDGNGVLSRVEAKSTRSISLSNIQARSMKGIEHFFNLRELSLGGQFTELDVSKNEFLQRLTCSSSNMTSLDVSHNTELELLDCGGSSLTALDLSHNTALRSLNCNNNRLIELDISKNTALAWLHCSNNQLTALDVSDNTALRELNCGKNQLTALDITNNTALETLFCRENNIIYLDARNCFSLRSIHCDPEVLIDNGTTPPKIFTTTITNARTGEPYSFQFVARGTTPLYLYVSGDVPEGLTLSGTGLLSGTTSDAGFHTFTFTASNDYGTASQVFTLKVREPVHDVAVINAENFPDEQFRGYVSGNFDTDRNGILDSDEAAEVVRLDLDFYGAHITSLKGIEYFTALTWLDAHGQELTELDLSRNTALTFLRCRSNPLKALDLSRNTELAYLNCRECPPLASLDLSRNTKLETIYCSGNSLTELDLSANTRLIAVECSSNDLVWLNIDSCGELTALGLPEQRYSTSQHVRMPEAHGLAA